MVVGNPVGVVVVKAVVVTGAAAKEEAREEVRVAAVTEGEMGAAELVV